METQTTTQNELDALKQRIATLEGFEARVHRPQVPKELTLAERMVMVAKLEELRVSWDRDTNAIKKKHDEASAKVRELEGKLKIAKTEEMHSTMDLTERSQEYVTEREPIRARLKQGAPTVLAELIAEAARDIAYTAAVQDLPVGPNAKLSWEKALSLRAEITAKAEARLRGLRALWEQIGNAWHLLPDDEQAFRARYQTAVAKLPTVRQVA